MSPVTNFSLRYPWLLTCFATASQWSARSDTSLDEQPERPWGTQLNICIPSKSYSSFLRSQEREVCYPPVYNARNKWNFRSKRQTTCCHFGLQCEQRSCWYAGQIIVHEYTCSRQTNRWPNKIFFNMLDIGAYNAFVIFTKKNDNMVQTTRSRRRLYIEELSKALCRPNIQRRLQTPQLSVKLRGLIENILDQPSDSRTPVTRDSVGDSPSQGRCVLCPRRKLARRRCTDSGIHLPWPRILQVSQMHLEAAGLYSSYKLLLLLT